MRSFPRPPDLSHNARAWAKFGRPEKRLRFSRAAEFGRARMAEPRASGPAALFALGAVFEAAALIYGGVFDALKLFSQKARGSRGRDPRSRRGAAVTSVHALVRRWAPLLLLWLLRCILKKRESLICGCLWMLLTFFRTAVRAGSTRALLTGMVGMLAGLVNLLMCWSHGAAGCKPARRSK